MGNPYKPEKKWRLVYTRSAKIHRARQLGMDYPRKGQSQMLAREAINVLFVCSMNRWRSPTAEKTYAKHDLVNARSAGLGKAAARTISPADLKWADVILVMEEKHRQKLVTRFPAELRYSEIHVLDIPDDYQYMDPELVKLIRESVDPILAKWCA